MAGSSVCLPRKKPWVRLELELEIELEADVEVRWKMLEDGFVDSSALEGEETDSRWKRGILNKNRYRWG